MSTAARRGVLVGAVVVLALLAWTAVALLSSRADLERARSLLGEVSLDGGVEELDPRLAEAQERLDRVAGRLRQPGPRLVSAVPVLGRTPTAVREAAEGAAAVTAASRDVVGAVPDDVLVDGAVDLAALGSLGVVADRAAATTQARVERLADVDTDLTPPVVADGVDELRREAADAADALRRTSSAVAALRGVLGADGPRRVLFALQNNAELRGTGGIVTVFAEGTARDGRVQLLPFRDVEDVADPAPEARPVRVPEDYGRLYGGFKAGTTLWKNVNMSPDVPTSSAVLAEVAATSLGRRPDAVVWFDVPLIASVLRAVGPVTLPDGSTLDEGNAVRRLLSDAYRQAPDTPEGQAQRRAQLRAAADAVLARLLGRGGVEQGSAGALARELGAAADGRHLALWSARPQEQQRLVDAGLDAGVTAGAGDLSALTVHNLGGGDRDGNKLDYYARRQTTVDVTVGEDDAEVVQTLALRNTAPARGLPVYVSGRATPGVSNSFVTLALPRGATGLEVTRDGRRLDARPQPEGDHAVLTDVAVVPPGRTVTWRLRYRLPAPDGRYALAVVPQPLAVDAGVAVTVAAADGLRLSHDVALSEPLRELVAVDVTARPPGRLVRARDAVRRFWSEPVELPW